MWSKCFLEGGSGSCLLSINNVSFSNSKIQEQWEENALNNFEKITRVGAIGVIWVLMLFGVLAAIALPFVASALVNEYREYANDFWVITGILLVPVILAETLLVIILVLLRRIRVDQMFSNSAHNWVRVLSYNAAALSVSFAVILVWLNIKNTLPPMVGLVLLIGFFLPLAVALVTRTLLVLLKQATVASEELEGVV